MKFVRNRFYDVPSLIYPAKDAKLGRKVGKLLKETGVVWDITRVVVTPLFPEASGIPVTYSFPSNARCHAFEGHTVFDFTLELTRRWITPLPQS